MRSKAARSMQSARAYAFLSPALLVLAFVFGYQLLRLFLFSFSKWQGYRYTSTYHLGNFATLFSGGVVGAPLLHFYGSAETLRRASDMFRAFYDAQGLLDEGVAERLNLELCAVEPFRAFQAGPYLVTPVPASHSPRLAALLYVVRGPDRTLFYGTDTGPLSEETWRGLAAMGVRFDVVILDHTCGLDESDGSHLDAAQFVEHIARMRGLGLLADGARALARQMGHKNAFYIEGLPDTRTFLRDYAVPEAVILTLGAGDITHFARSLAEGGKP